MMSERRALLDPEMYKISEEDSQDEEVLASYTEDALKLGIGGGDDISNGNTALSVGRHSRVSWNSGGSRYSRREDSRGSWEYSGDISSSQFNPGKLRIAHGLSSRHGSSQHHSSRSSSGNNSSTAVRMVTNNVTNNDASEDNSVDWPESSTNSDSCLSNDDPERRGATTSHRKGHSHSSATKVYGAMNNSKFIGKTYFGENVRHEGRGNSGDHVVQGCSSSVYLRNDNHHRYSQGSRPPPEYQSHSRNYPSQCRRGNSRNSALEDELSSSGSECSENHDDDGCSSSGSSSPCAECISSRGSGHHHRHGDRRSACSSSEVEEYDSSYTESSYDDDDYDEYYDDDDDDANESFDDIVKFLSDSEVEASTNADGDLFLVEYSDDESADKVSFNGTTSLGSFESSGQQGKLGASAQQSSHVKDDDGTESIASTPSQDSGRINSREGGGNQDNSTSTASPSVNAQKYQKSSAGKGAKGKISRLLKRKGKNSNSSSKPTAENSSSAPAAPASVLTTTSETPSPQPSSSSTPVAAASTSSTPSPANHSGLGRKAKGESSGTSAPEKVFRFKDEHGGETRTVFVDIPQSARTGNLLGRRATLIESILGIIPDHFSTPPSLDRRHQPGSSNSDRIMVGGFVPDGVASKYRRIKIGDWLQSVDDIPVDHGNVDQVLSARSMYGKRRTAFETEFLRLKLTLRRVAGCMVSLPASSASPQSGSSPEDTPTRSSRVTSITELSWSKVGPQVQSNIAIVFISNSAIDEEAPTQGESSASTSREKSKDIVYSWPLESESKMVKALAASQGMFSTLYRLLWDVTGSHPVTSKVVIDDCEMDVTYTSDNPGTSLLLVGVATSLSTFTLHHHSRNEQVGQKGKGDKGGSDSVGGTLPTGTGEGKKKEKKIRWREPQSGGVTVSTRVLNRIENVLKYQFGSFERAFRKSNVNKVNRILTNALAALNDLSEDFLFLQVPGNFLRFPNCIRSGIDDVLYSFESSETPTNTSRGNNRVSRADSSASSSRRRHKESQSPGLPVYHCHGACLMYKGFLITSHLENDLASAFHGWWRTQLGLWEGIRRNAILEKWKPVSRLALWQQTCISKRGIASVPPPDTVPQECGGAETEPHANGITRSSVGKPKLARCFSALVGIGNFTLGFVLEHLTDYQGDLVPDSDWLRRAMATLCRLHRSGLSRSFESWLGERNGGRDEFVEICGTASQTPVRGKQTSRQGKVVLAQGPNKGSVPQPRKTPVTGSILKNATEASGFSAYNCPVHSQNSLNLSTSSGSNACTCSQSSSSSPMLKGFLIGSSSSSTSSFGGGIRSGITGGIMVPPSPDEYSSLSRFSTGSGDPAAGFESDADDVDADDTTTGTGSDNSSFKWYERAVSEPAAFGSEKGDGSDVKHIRVTRGNVLLDYVQVEFGRGVILSSKDIHEGWAAAIRHNFRQSVTIIHHILHKAANARQRLEERSNDKKWVSLALAPISEHGILFNCNVVEPRDAHKKKPRKREVSYWVVGRIYPEEREIYVCYEDGPLSQNLVEIAYKIALNVQC